MANLKLSTEDFKRGYDANFIPYMEFLKHANADYVSWSGCELLLNRLFPNIVRCSQEVEYLYEDVQEYDEFTTTVIEYENVRIDKPVYQQVVIDSHKSIDAKSKDAQEHIKYDNVRIDEPVYKQMITKKVTESKKTPTKKSRRIVGINIITTLMDRTTGEVSEQQSFPVMNKDAKRSAATSPDARLINDNKQRAFVRAVASVTGIGLRLWTREGMDTMGGDKNHMLFTYLQRISTLEDEYAAKLGLPDDYERANFGMNIQGLATRGKALSDKLKELSK